MFKKIRKLLSIVKFYFEDEDNLLLYLLEIKAKETLEMCYNLGVGSTEEIEDLIFHIKSYYDIPEAIALAKYPKMQEMDIPTLIKEYKKDRLDLAEVMKFADFLEDVEKQRAVEREIIFEHAKVLSFGFRL